MSERDCEHCEHSKKVYSEQLHMFVNACEVWDCPYDKKESPDFDCALKE